MKNLPNNSTSSATTAILLNCALAITIALSFDSAFAVAPFGMADPKFNSPQFTSRAYPSYCRSDGRGGLLWTGEWYFHAAFSSSRMSA